MKTKLDLDYRLVQTDEEYEELKKRLEASDVVAFDYETYEQGKSGFAEQFEDSRNKAPIDFLDSKIAGVSFSVKPGQAFYVPVCHKDTRCFSEDQVLELLSTVREDAALVAHNLWFEYLITKNVLGAELCGNLWDTMVMAYMINENRKVGLKWLAKAELGYIMPSYQGTVGENRMNEITGEDVRVYGCCDSDMTLRLYYKFYTKLEELGLIKYVQVLETRMIPILVSMFLDGVSIDKDELERQTLECIKSIIKLKDEIGKMAGKDINLNSPKQVANLLYKDLDLRCSVFTDSGSPSVSSEALAKLKDEHPVVENISQYRKLTKRLTAFYQAYPIYIHPYTGKIHSQFSLIARDQDAINTGRLGSSQPNLMQIPKRGEGRIVRKIFIPHKDLGHDLVVTADWSQIELRVLAFFARPKRFLDAYVYGSDDLHTQTGRAIFGEKLTKTLRDVVAKPTNFLIIYGGGASTLAKNINVGSITAGLDFRVTEAEAEKFIQSYFEIYPEVKEFMVKQIRFCKQHGYVTSIFGRRFNLPYIRSSNSELRRKAERKTVNSPIQGSAAEIMKWSIINIVNNPKYQKWYNQNLVRLVALIHDELVFSINSEILDEFAALLRKHMTTAPEGFDIPLETDISIGPNFAEVKPYEVQS